MSGFGRIGFVNRSRNPRKAVKFLATITDYANQTIVINAGCMYGHSAAIHWGDGNITPIAGTGSASDRPHQYSKNGVFNIVILGDIGYVMRVEIAGQSLVNLIPSSLYGLTNCLYLSFFGSATSMELSPRMAGLPSLQFFVARDRCFGDAAYLALCENLGYIDIREADRARGDVGALLGLPLGSIFANNAGFSAYTPGVCAWHVGFVGNFSGNYDFSDLHIVRMLIDMKTARSSGWSATVTVTGCNRGSCTIANLDVALATIKGVPEASIVEYLDGTGIILNTN